MYIYNTIARYDEVRCKYTILLLGIMKMYICNTIARYDEVRCRKLGCDPNVPGCPYNQALVKTSYSCHPDSDRSSYFIIFILVA